MRQIICIDHDAVFRYLRYVHNLSIGSYKLFVFACTHLASFDKLEHEDKHAQMYLTIMQILLFINVAVPGRKRILFRF